MDVYEIRRERVRQLIRDTGSQAAFARRVETTASTVSRWLYEPDRDGAKNIGERKAREIEQKLGKPAGWLDNLSLSAIPNNPLALQPRLTEPPATYGQQAARKVYVVGKGQGGLAERVWTDGDYPTGATDEYAELATTDRHAFLIRVEGLSMSPRYMPGEFALVEPGTEPDLEDDVLVRLKTGETMLKRLLSRRAGITLGSYNDPVQYNYQAHEITWVYYVAHPVPARKIKTRM